MILFCAVVAGHNIPSQLPDPQSTGEAWNVLEGSASNIDNLLAENLLRDVTFQIANCDGSLKYLGSHSEKVQLLTRRMLADGSDLIGAIRDPKSSPEGIKSQWKQYRKELGELEGFYQPELLHAEVFICPMHPLDPARNPRARLIARGRCLRSNFTRRLRVSIGCTGRCRSTVFRSSRRSV